MLGSSLALIVLRVALLVLKACQQETKHVGGALETNPDVILNPCPWVTKWFPIKILDLRWPLHF